MGKTYDVIIVGAGLVGASLALALSQQQCRVALLDRRALSMGDSSDQRPLSLAYGSQQILVQLGVWSLLSGLSGVSQDNCAIQQVHVSEQHRFGVTRFRAADYQLPALGYVVRFQQLQSALYQLIMQQKSIEFYQIDALDQLNASDKQSDITVKIDGQLNTLQANLIIGADGTHSVVRKKLGITTRETDRNEVALTALIELTQPHAGCAYERFTRQGVLAILPLQDSYQCRLVWTMPAKQYDQLVTKTDAELLNTVETVFKYRLGPLKNLQRGGQAYPLKTVIADKRTVPGAVLVGNAAHTIYPLAAQGFNLGLREVAALASVIGDAYAQGRRVDSDSLARYSASRESDEQAIIKLTGSLSRVFAWPLLGVGRGLGLLSLGCVRRLRDRVAMRTMGLMNG